MQVLKINNKTISTPLPEIVKNIRNNLNNGKLKCIKVMGSNIRITCPHHNNGLENTPAGDIYIGEPTEKVEYGWFKCFVCGEQGPFYHFVAECFDTTDEWAKEWLINNYADGIIEYQLDLPEIDLRRKKPEYLDESIISTFEDFHPYMTKRKLTKEVCKQFEVKYDPKTESLVFPVRDEKGKLIMFTRRSVNNKTFVIDAKKEKPIYLLYYLLKRNIQEAIVVESQINCLTCHSYNLPSIALFGTGSQHQYDVLNKCGIRRYILCFDGDDAGNKGIQKFIKNIRKDVFIDIVKMPSGKDVNDLSKDEFFKLLQNWNIDTAKLIEVYDTQVNA